MPFLHLTKRSKEMGVQTFARARILPEPMRAAEMEYLSYRDWYVDQLNRLAQFGEALEQAKADRNTADIKEFGDKIHGIEATITAYRDRVKEAGRGSFAVAYMLAADIMLPPEMSKEIRIEAEKILGRPADELARR